MTIHVHIERLVIEGEAEPAHGPQIRRGLQRELTRLLREGGLSRELSRGGAVPLLRGGEIGGRSNAGPIEGRNIAGAVYAGIGVRK